MKKDPNAKLNYKLLEQVRGYLCHLAMTYEILFPYLKGFHLTLCSHLPLRNEEGWKMQELEWLGFLEQSKEKVRLTQFEIDETKSLKFDYKNHPLQVQLVPRFHSCLTALSRFFEPDHPPVITERWTNIHLRF